MKLVLTLPATGELKGSIKCILRVKCCLPLGFEIDGIDENHLSKFIHILLKKKIFNKSSSILTDIIIDLFYTIGFVISKIIFCNLVVISKSLNVTWFRFEALSQGQFIGYQKLCRATIEVA